ncbi:MAG: transposase, partial [Proteobacteria bacterium]|nr:transposase [Pseudomonadota bacterium]
LPPYSPEYNPVERVWGWIKQKVYGFKAFGGIQYLIKKFRTFIWHFNRRKLTKPINLKLEVYHLLL